MSQREDDLVVLTSASSEIQASLYCSILDSQGIPSVGPNSAATTLRWEVGSTDPYRVYVRRADLERARSAISRERADSVDIDWDEVDVGDPGPGDAEPREPSARETSSARIWVGLIALLLAIAVISLVASRPGWLL